MEICLVIVQNLIRGATICIKIKMDKFVSRSSEKNLRKLISERKHLNQLGKNSAEKIHSPLLNTRDLEGNLSCIICGSNVKSLTVWKVHINSKQHKQKVEEAKKLKDQILNTTKVSTTQSVTNDIYKKVSHNTLPQSEITSSNNSKKEKDTSSTKEVLPELFFDEPTHKRKFTKDPLDEEWELFQREIKEATIESNSIIAEEQSEAYEDNQIIEIDEQIHHWSKVINLEKKLNDINYVRETKRQQVTPDEQIYNENDDLEILEELDWRCKSLK